MTVVWGTGTWRSVRQTMAVLLCLCLPNLSGCSDSDDAASQNHQTPESGSSASTHASAKSAPVTTPKADDATVSTAEPPSSVAASITPANIQSTNMQSANTESASETGLRSSDASTPDTEQAPYLEETSVTAALEETPATATPEVDIFKTYTPAELDHLAPEAVIDWSLPPEQWEIDRTSEWSEAQSRQLHQGIVQAFMEASESDEESVEWSGRLHWDESEQGLEKPLMDSVTGAELEIRIRLP